MSFFPKKQIQNIAVFNPSEKLPKGTIAKSVPMAMLKEFQRKIKGYEIKPFNGGAKFRNGDILLAKITPCLENGKTAFVDILDEDEVAFGSTEFIVLRANENTNPEFLYYFSTSPDFRKRAIECMEGTSGRQRVNENTLKTLELPIPDLPTQQAIASVLSALDQKIAINNQINAQLEQMAKTLYDYWFVQFDFPDENGKPYQSSGGEMVYNDTLKRHIPKGWEVKSLGELGEIVGGSTPSTTNSDNFCNNGTAWITPNDLSKNQGNKFISHGEIDVTDSGIKDASLKKYPAGTVLMSSRAPIGYMAIARNEVTTNQGFKSFIPNKGFSKEFVFYAVKNSLKAIIQSSSGSTFKEVSSTTLRAIQTVLPNKNISNQYSQLVSEVFKKQDILEQQNQQLTQLRDFLLPMLMNGQVGVLDVQVA